MNVDVLAIGAHPDDVEMSCGGTLARLIEAGHRVGILHLTRGEMGTRGTPEQRRREAEGAAEALGVHDLTLLDLGDGGLRTGVEEEDALIREIRRLRPEIVLAPPPRDRHPDHGRAHRLVVDACFYAGLVKRMPGAGEAHRPAASFFYFQHHLLTPSFVVEIGPRGWAAKARALAAYESQLYQGPEAAPDLPETRVASREFAAAIEGRARYFGQLIGGELGEPFWSSQPLAIGDLAHLVPEGRP